MARESSLNLIIGVLMIVFGVLLILGEFALQSLLPFLGIVLIVLGVLIIAKVLPGGVIIAVVSIIAGILLLEGFFDWGREIRDFTEPVFRIVNIVAGVILLILGIQRVR